MSNVFLEVEDKVAVITIDAPPVNALNKDVFNNLEKAINEIEDHINVVIVTGAGNKAFVAGADIREFPELTPEEGEALTLRGQEVFTKLSQLKQPVIAAIDGFTLGGGLELALACDIRIATKTSTFGFPEVKLGIIPGYGGTQRLSRLVGLGKAMQILLSGEFITADEAYRIRLIEEMAEGDALEEAKKLAASISLRGPIAVQTAKSVMLQGSEMSLEEGLKLEAKQFGVICETKDKVEGVAAFLEKRNPTFIGK
ncbi:enoyl-CoA hydratase/isomerase family protein [Sporosarcina sp. CAU 1771]